MIFTLLIDVFKVALGVLDAILTPVASFLPTWDVSGFGAAVVDWMPQQLKDLMRWANYYVPLREAILLTSAALGVWAALMAYRFVLSILRKLHILGAG
jgi:hypothetical protein